MIHPYSVFLLAFLSFFQVKAADTFSDFLFILPTQNLPQEFDFSVNAFDNGSLKIESSTVKIEANPLVSSGDIHVPNLKVNALAVGLKYSEIIQIVDKNWSGSFLVEAQCESLEIKLSGAARLKWDESTRNLNFVSWKSHEGQTDVQGKNCTGVKGFEVYLSRIFKKSEFIEKLIKDRQEELKTWLMEKSTPFYNDWQSLGSLYWKLTRIMPGEGQVLGTGTFYLRESGEERREFKLQSPNLVDQPALIVPQDFLKRWMRSWLIEQTGGFNWKSSDIPEFRSLMRSRFLQFFFWPELMSFPKSTVFTFQFRHFEITDVETLGKNQISLKAVIDGEIVSDSKGPYLNVKWDLPLIIVLHPENGELKIHIADVGSSPELSLSRSYVYKYSKGFPRSHIQKAIREQLQDKVWTFSMPKELLKGVEFDGFDTKEKNAYFLFRLK